MCTWYYLQSLSTEIASGSDMRFFSQNHYQNRSQRQLKSRTIPCRSWQSWFSSNKIEDSWHISISRVRFTAKGKDASLPLFLSLSIPPFLRPFESAFTLTLFERWLLQSLKFRRCLWCRAARVGEGWGGEYSSFAEQQDVHLTWLFEILFFHFALEMTSSSATHSRTHVSAAP